MRFHHFSFSCLFPCYFSWGWSLVMRREGLPLPPPLQIQQFQLRVKRATNQSNQRSKVKTRSRDRYQHWYRSWTSIHFAQLHTLVSVWPVVPPFCQVAKFVRVRDRPSERRMLRPEHGRAHCVCVDCWLQVLQPVVGRMCCHQTLWPRRARLVDTCRPPANFSRDKESPG